MKIKIKIIIASITIIILTIAAGVFYVSRGYKKNTAEVAVATQVDKKKIATDIEKEKADKIQPLKTIAVAKIGTGSITQIKGNVILVKTQENDITLSVTDTTSFYVIDKGNPIMKSINDLKKDDAITFEYDATTKNALSVKIIQK